MEISNNTFSAAIRKYDVEKQNEEAKNSNLTEEYTVQDLQKPQMLMDLYVLTAVLQIWLI